MLSICIPSFNRYPFLEWGVKRLRADFPGAEIIVSDNASTDDTPHIRLRRDIKYLCQPENIGPFPNMLKAFQGATGRYAVYCADDDYLLPDQVAAAIEFMDAHPECAAYCAPCEIWNEVAGTTFWNAFKVEKERFFDITQGMDLFNFIIQSHIWPEHIIYRTPVPLERRTAAYWAFADIPDILAKGAIYFAKTPFYRNLLIHPMGERVQLGNEQCLTDFDNYRGGLEVLAYGLFGSELPYKARHRIHEMIQWFICARMDVASRLYIRQGRESEALMLRKRLSIATPARDAA